jgi:broad specificity phosphatase PhoE
MTMGHRVAAAALAAWSAMVALPGAALASEQIWTLLKGGGHAILMRHAVTTPGVGDPPGMRLDDCRSQRNLTDEGRRHARQIGEAFRARDIAIARVLTSPWCRCRETAQLAFGAADVSPALSNLYGRSDQRGPQVRELTAIVSEPPRGGNLVLVSHGSTIAALTGARSRRWPASPWSPPRCWS